MLLFNFGIRVLRLKDPVSTPGMEWRVALWDAKPVTGDSRKECVGIGLRRCRRKTSAC